MNCCFRDIESIRKEIFGDDLASDSGSVSRFSGIFLFLFSYFCISFGRFFYIFFRLDNVTCLLNLKFKVFRAFLFGTYLFTIYLFMYLYHYIGGIFIFGLYFSFFIYLIVLYYLYFYI